MVKILYAVIDERKKEGFEVSRIVASGEYEIMLFETRASFEVGGEMREYPPCTCILYQPGQRVHYRSSGEGLVYSRIQFHCDEALYRSGFLPFGVPVFCLDYQSYKIYWQAAANEYGWNYASSPYIMTRLMYIIFHRLHDDAYADEDSGY